MLTPRFSFSQDISTLIIKIRAPYCDLRELDLSVEKNEFIFVCSPYYLRLNLPGCVIENQFKSSFHADTGEFTFVCTKENNGEEFLNLDFITTFLQPKSIEIEEGGRKIELLTSERDCDCVVEDFVEQYGFALRGGYNFKSLSLEFKEIFSVDPFEVKFNDRRNARFLSEKEKFDPDHYIADIMEDSEITEICNLKCPWEDMMNKDTNFTETELDFLKDLPNINYNLTPQQITYCHNSLVDLLYAYCYDYRTTFFEGTCESGWTISTLSASLCWCDSFSSVKDAVICTYRRSLIYPLYRSFKLCDKVFEDLKLLLKLGSKYVVRCLINIRNIFHQGNSGRYILNKLYIDDYIIYIMKSHSSNLCFKLLEELSKFKISKTDLGLNLLELEKSLNNEELATVFGKLKVKDSDDSGSSFESTEDSEDSSDSSENEVSSSDSEECSSDSEECVNNDVTVNITKTKR